MESILFRDDIEYELKVEPALDTFKDLNLDIVVDTVAGTTVSTDKPELLEVTQAYEDNGAVFNPGAKALAAGTAILTVTNPDNSIRDITVTITQ